MVALNSASSASPGRIGCAPRPRLTAETCGPLLPRRRYFMKVSVSACLPEGRAEVGGGYALISAREPVADFDVLGFELDPGSFRLQQEQRGEILVGVAVPDQRLHHVARDRGERHRN